MKLNNEEEQKQMRFLPFRVLSPNSKYVTCEKNHFKGVQQNVSLLIGVFVKKKKEKKEKTEIYKHKQCV